MTERVKVFKIEPFGYTLEVVVTDDFNASILKRVNKLGDIRKTDNAVAFTAIPENSSKVWVFLPPMASMNSIAHETVHVVAYVMKDIGAVFEEEIWAYFIGDICEKICEFTWKDSEKKVENNP